MTKKLIFSFFIVLAVSSCASKEETTYRIVGKNGKAIYLEKKVPTANKQYKKDHKNNNISEEKTGYNTNESNSKTVAINNPNREVPDINNSSAYTLSSIMDGTVKYGDTMNSSAQDINSKSKHKTINDFNNLPESYFALDEKKVAADNIKKKQAAANTATQAQKNSKTNSKSKPITETPIATFIDGKLYYVQLGFFVGRDRAIKLKNDFSDISNIRIVEAKNNSGDSIYKVIVGGYKDRKDADNIAKMVKNRGHEDVYIFQK